MCYSVMNLIHRISLFSPPFISLAFHSGVRSRVWCHHQHSAHVSIFPRTMSWGCCPHSEPFRRCWRWWNPCELTQGLHVPLPRMKCSCKVFALSSGTPGESGWLWCGVWLSQARDGVVATAGALALIKVVEGWISLFCPRCYLLPWKVSKLWLHNYDSFPQASVSTI